MVAQSDPHKTDTGHACYHCGDDCGAHPVVVDDKQFCCDGCRLVYEILAENDMCKYYQLEDRPGLSLKGRREERYAYLDDPEIVERLVDYRDEERTRITFYLPQIHCASCIWLLENLYRLDEAIRESKVNFLKKELYLSFDTAEGGLRRIVELLASIGYAPEINLGDSEAKSRKVSDRNFYYRLGVAGFAFGNIMLLSFPEYLGLDQRTAIGWEKVFSVLNIALALPVVFYSGSIYLQSAWQGLRRGNLNIDLPITIGILALFFRSLFDIIVLGEAGYLDSLAGLVFFLLIGRWFQQTTYHHLSFERDYKSYFPIAATRIEEGQPISVPLRKLEVGDVVRVRHQEIIPADGLLKKGEARVDYSFVTGEDEPVGVEEGERVYAGGRQVGGAVDLILVKTPSQSYLTRLWNDEAFAAEDKTAVSRLADAAGRFFTIAILLIASATFLYWYPTDISIAFNAATAVLIIACPCAVALSIPFTLGNALRLLARKGFYLKNTGVIEKVREVTTVVFDKTGTITRTSRTAVSYQGSALDEREQQWVRSICLQSHHPVSRAIAQHLPEQAVLPVGAGEEKAGAGLAGRIDGHTIRLGNADWVDPSVEGDDREGTLLSIDGRYRGTFAVRPGLRQGFGDLVRAWKERFRLFVLSGDSDRDRALLSGYLEDDQMFFRHRPEQKLAFIREQQAQDETVLMLGDGLNDAGALKQADLGIVVAEDTNNFTPASDAILDAGSFAQLPALLRFARKSIFVVYASFALAALYNIIGLSFAVRGALSPVVAAILMPLSSVTVVAFGVALSSYFYHRIVRK